MTRAWNEEEPDEEDGHERYDDNLHYDVLTDEEE